MVVKRLRSERLAEIALFAKEARLLNTPHHENIVETQGCCFSPCALVRSYQCFNFHPFGIEEVNTPLQFLEVMDYFEETLLTVFSPTVPKIAQDSSHIFTIKMFTRRDL